VKCVLHKEFTEGFGLFFLFWEKEGKVNPQRQDGEMYIFSCQNGELSFEKYKEKAV
jgi:hypothetical protein